MRYCLPALTGRIIDESIQTCQNMGLVLDKYPIWAAVKDSKGKGEWFREILSNTHYDREISQQAYNRWFTMTKTLGAQPFQAQLNWRMVVGLGGETVLETDLTLHHLYGIPYIPGSALKGLTRGYVTTEEQRSANLEQDSIEVKRIFGTQNQTGSVIFFDAMPLNGEAVLKLDIMNAHYPDYYGEKKFPTNDQSPNPITFLTVAAATIFVFALAPRNPMNETDRQDMEKARSWMQTALQKYGVGSKTSAGYGRFQVSEQADDGSVSTSQKPQSVPPTTLKRGDTVDPGERIRIPLPQFRIGQEMRGSVLALTDEQRQQIFPEAYAFLQYESFPTKDVLIVVLAEEAQHWKSGETRLCQLVEFQEKEGQALLLCQMRSSKKKKK